MNKFYKSRFNIQIMLLLLLIVSQANLLRAQTGTADGVYNFSGTVGTNIAGFKRLSDKFLISSDLSNDGTVLYLSSGNSAVPGSEGTGTIKAEGGTVCKQFTLKNMALSVTPSKQTPEQRIFASFTITLINSNGTQIASHSISSPKALTPAKTQVSSFVDGWPTGGYNNVSQIQLSWKFSSANPGLYTPAELNIENVDLANITATTGSTNTLSPGDLAVIGMNAGPDGYSTPSSFTDPTRQFAIVALAAIPANEEIFITDRGWVNGSPGSFTTFTNLDGTIKFVPSAVIPAGTVMIFKVNALVATSQTISVSKPDGTAVPTTELTMSGWTQAGVSTPWNKDTGDQLLIYQGSAATPTFIFAFNNITSPAYLNSFGGWSTDPGSNSGSGYHIKGNVLYSELPNTLPAGNSVGFFTPRTERFPNVSYSPLAGMTSGSKAEWLADIITPSRWTSSSSADTPQNFADGFGASNIKLFNMGSTTATDCTISATLTDVATQSENFYERFGQSFTACQSGKLSKIRVLYNEDSNPSDRTLTIRQGGGLSGNLLGTITIPKTSLVVATTGTDFTTIDVSSLNISVTSGQSYTFSFEGSDANKITLYYGKQPSPGVYESFYAGGVLYQDGVAKNNFDLIFEVEIGPGSTSTNTSPTATLVTVTGTATVGQTLTGGYTYADAESNTESGSTFKWYRSDNSSGLNKTAIAAATSATYTLVSADAGKYISFEVTPRDGTAFGTAVESNKLGAIVSGSTGYQAIYNFENLGNNNTSFTSSTVNFTLTGNFIGQNIPNYGSDSPPSAGYMDTGFGANLSGNVGGLKTNNHEIFKLVSIDVWPSANRGSQPVLPYGTQIKIIGKRNGLQVAEGTYTSVTFNQTPDALGGNWHRVFVTGTLSSTDIDEFAVELLNTQNYMAVDQFSYKELRSVPANTAPTATLVTVTGTATVGQTLTGSYTYTDTENNTESGSTFKWYRSDNNSGLNKTAISGATANTYTLVSADANKYISFEVTPRDGTTNGTPTESTSRGPVVATLVGTTLVAGDIAVLGINSDDTYPNQRWAFVPLVNLTSGTVIHFTDASYDGATVDANKFYVNDLNEGHMTWTVPSAVAAGTTFIVTNNSGLGNATIKDIVNTSYTGVIGSLGGSSSGFSQAGDQIIVYQGTGGTTVGATFIYAFNNGQSPANYPVKGTWASSGIISAQGISYLPTGLINGTSAIALTSNATSGSTSDGLSYGYDNMKYKGTTSGTKASLLAAIGSAVNWEGHDATAYDFATIGNFNLSANTPPTATAVSIGGTLTVGQVLTGEYTYGDSESNIENGSTFKWYRSEDNTGLNKVAIASATTNTYTLVAADANKYISFEVTPRDGTSFGTALESSKLGPVVALPSGVLLSTNPTLTFSNNNGFTDNIASDGEGGSIAINDINIQIYPIDIVGTKLTATPLEYHNGTHSGWTGYPSIIVYGVTPNTPYYGWTIKSDNGDNFALRSLNFHDWGNYNGAEFTIEAFNGGVSKGTATFTGNTDGNFVPLSNPGILGNIFKNVDEVRIYQSDQNNSYIALNDISFGPAEVTSNNPPTATLVTVTGTLTVGQTLTGGYTYADAESNTESGSTFKWYRSDDNTGLNKVAIASATANTYTLVAADAGKYISFEVIPNDGTAFGTAVESEKKGPINSAVSILYVNKNVIGGTGTGDSWINAKVELADALKEAKTNTAIKEIWVAKGTYKPKYSPEDGTNFGTDKGKDNTFLLVAGVKVYGGFAGTEITLAERNLSIVANASILSGDLDNNDQNDGTIIGNNAYHVVLSSGTMSNATLNGFTIKGGNASATGNISVNGNTIDQNKGGGLAIIETANLSLSNLDITLNNAGSGAGISNVNSSPYIEFAKISNNKVFGGDGAGMANRSSSPKIVNSIIHHNGTAYRGGGIYNAISAPELINVTIADNIIASNGSGAGVLNDGGTSIVSNSIIWGDNASAIQGNPSTVKNSIIKGGYNGTNVINQDPKFNDAANGDYTLKAGSPAINNGNNTLFTGLDANTKDLAGNTRVYKYIDNGIIDLGAYEVQSDIAIPTVASVSVPTNSTYTIDQHLDFIINFDEAVSVVTTGGTPRIVLTVGNNTRYAEYVSGSDSSALTFRYIVASGDVDTDGITIVALDLNNGSVKNSVGNDVALTLNNVGSTTGVLVDGTPNISQTITFNILPAKTYGDTDFEPGATSDNSGIPITYTSSNTNVATIVNGKIHIIAAGTSTITASQAGDATHNAATDVQQTLTVNKKTITVTAAAKSKTYGDADPALTYDFDPALVSGDSFTGSLERTTGSTVGTYPINQGTLTLNSNYTLTYVGADLTIGKKTITVTAAAKNKTYGDADPALTYDFAPALVSGDSFTGNLERTTGSAVGTYPINQGTLALSSNYTLTYVGANLTIGKKTITVTVAAKNKTYGDADPELTYTFAPELVSGDSFTGSLERTTGSTVGTYPINQGTLALNSNYTLTYVVADLTIGKKTITVTAAAKSKTYGDADPELTYTFDPALVSGDSFTGNLERTTGSAVGTYPINQGTLALNSNYTLTYTGADLTIGAKTVTVTAAAKSKTYGDADSELTYTFAPELVSGDSFTGSLERTTGSAVGTYPINQGTLALSSNYTLTYIGADLTIGKKTITVTAAAKSKTYGDADPVLTYDFAPALVSGDSFSGNLARANGNNVGNYAINQGTLALNSNYTLTYVGADLTIGAKTVAVTAVEKSKTYGDADPALTYDFAPVLVSGDTFSGGLSRTAGQNVGTYAINQGTLALNSNYTLTYVGADLTIGKKTITVTAAAKSKTYGDADPALTYDFAPALVSGDTFSGSLSRTAGQNVGTYNINQGTLALNGNYTLTYVGADFTIGKKTITVTAAAKSKTYGDADPALTYDFTPALVSGDSFSGSLTRLPGQNVGTYAINQGTLALNSNYTLTYVGADLTIGKKTITVTAVAKSKTYGDADPALTYDFAPALVTGDTFSGSLTRLPGQNVGTYAINQGTLALNSNYTLTYIGANFTIGKKTITVTAAAKSKTYGDADPALTYTFAPALVTGDTFSGNLARANGNNVGTYAINKGTLALNSNYTLTYVGADLVITAKPITVTTNASQSKVYGTADPVYTYSVSPALVSGDSFTGALGRVAGNDAGVYAITQGTLNAGTNYNLTYVGSNFTIIKANQTITWNQTLGFGCEGETTVILTATSSSGLPVSYTSSNSNLASISGNSLNLLNYGSVTISANQLGNNNYNPAVVVSLPLVNSQPNLIRKQFENIIFFDNSSKSFSTYTWYKNGVLVPGQTDQYFKENGPLNGTYYAVATKLDGIVVTTCPLVLSPTVEDEYIKIVPNPVKPNASYELLNNVPTARLQNARIEVYSVGGLLLENKTTSQNTVTLKAPTVEGIYIIKMTLANGKYFTKNLLVKN